uniref:Uncharacterized protein n=1 Tax=Helianthus annuus TaxID=4232 RepID=A0A251VDB7_HELAN
MSIVMIQRKIQKKRNHLRKLLLRNHGLEGKRMSNQNPHNHPNLHSPPLRFVLLHPNMTMMTNLQNHRPK